MMQLEENRVETSNKNTPINVWTMKELFHSFKNVQDNNQSFYVLFYLYMYLF